MQVIISILVFVLPLLFNAVWQQIFAGTKFRDTTGNKIPRKILAARYLPGRNNVDKGIENIVFHGMVQYYIKQLQSL